MKYLVIAVGSALILTSLAFVFKAKCWYSKVEVENNDFLAALYSTKINSEIQKEDIFGQLVGTWEFEWFGRDKSYDVKYEKGEWIFSWILEGRVMQDIWILPGRNRRFQAGLPKGEYGTTLRFYNIKNKVWNVVWIGPINGNLRTFEAKKIGNEIVIEGIDRTKSIIRWIISDITKNKFRWRYIKSNNEGKSWNLIEEMNVRRKNF